LKPDRKNLKNLFTEDEFLRGNPSNGVSREEIISLAEDIWADSAESALAFLHACPAVLSFLSKEEFDQWVLLGSDTLKESPGTSELCKEYFQSSPVIISTKSFQSCKNWAKKGIEIAQSSPEIAIEYFRSTPAFIENVESFQFRKWAHWAMQIMDSSEMGESASVIFLSSSVVMLRFMSFSELKDWFTPGLLLAKHSAELASSYFSLKPETLDALYRSERSEVYRLASVIAQSLPEEAITFYRTCLDVLIDLNPNVRSLALRAAGEISSEEPDRLLDTFEMITSAILHLPYATQESVMRHGAAVGKKSIEASREYYRNIGTLLSEIPEFFLSCWVEDGLSILQRDEKCGINYFALKSEEYRQEAMKWMHAILLEDYRHILTLLAQALAGKGLQVQSTEELAPEKSSKVRPYPTSDGHTIYLPPYSAGEKSSRDNFRQYKVATAHQAGYVEFGSFESGLDAIRSLLEALPLQDLALDIFFILEDGRIDHMLREEYAGLRRDIDIVIADAMSRRPSLRELPLQEALVEVLLRLTVGYGAMDLSPPLSKHAAFLSDTLAGFYDQARGVWSCFFKALEIYEYLELLPNVLPEQEIDAEVKPALDDNFPYSPALPIPFRGRYDPAVLPEPIQLKIPSYEIVDDESGIPMSLEELKRILENIDNYHFQIHNGKDTSSQGLFLNDPDGIPARIAVNDPYTEDQESQNRPFLLRVRLTTLHDGPHYYDEWDYLQKTYRRRWCCLRERGVDPGDARAIDEIYASYHELIQRVRKQFQRIRPTILEPLRRVEWGDEIDLTALIRYVVDRRAGSSPSDRIFSRKEKKMRRISTLLLIDMSASTDIRVPSVAIPNSPWEHRIDQTEESGERGNRDKRVIDIEVESLVVMMEALEALDDEYAIFGFSGYGRDSVDFYRIKDFDDHDSEAIKSRIGGIQPKQSTRMGTAIRHAIGKLRPIESDQRLLILLSDGFPQDHDYGEDRRSNEYALHDTMMALLEAKREGIRPFCITVDKSGNDYLRKMIDPSSYLIIQDIYSLPEILPRVVESLMS
jgi:nitric oxide reductase NorD protein